MTRINVVPVEELHDKHLLAEYRELPRIVQVAEIRKDAPKEYTLGAGHMLFFYDKLAFLNTRFKQIVAECKKRGFKIQYEELPDRHFSTQEAIYLSGSYKPTPEALALNRARLKERAPKTASRKPTKKAGKK